MGPPTREGMGGEGEGEGERKGKGIRKGMEEEGRTGKGKKKLPVVPERSEQVQQHLSMTNL